MSTIGTVQQLAVTTITPLHIGAGGGDLLDDLDYVSDERVYVIDQERMLAGLSSERLRRAEQAAPLSQLLSPAEWRDYARYSLPNPTGRERVPRMLGQVKDAFGRPYLPGSSLKGPIRTALAWALLRAEDKPVGRSDLGYNPRFADDPLMGRLLGRDPYHDLFRAMQVADSAAIAPGDSLDLLRVSLYSLRGQRLLPKGEGWSFFVEALRPGAELRLRLRLDDYLLAPEIARRVDLEGGEAWLRGWLGHCQAFSEEVIRYEQGFYAYYGPPELAAFYDDLAVQAQGVAAGREALLQLAWGAGWLSKTVGMYLSDDELAMVRDQFRLGRAGVEEFPKSRRLVERGGRPGAPLGWVRLRLLDGGAPVLDAPPPPRPVTPPPGASRESAVPPPVAPVAPPRAVTPPRPAAGDAPASPRSIADLRPGMVLEGTVKRIADYGAFVDIGVGRDGLLHISQLSERRVERVEDVLRLGQRVRVKVLNVDVAQRKISLTMRGV